MTAVRFGAALVGLAGLSLGSAAQAATGTIHICSSITVLPDYASANFGNTARPIIQGHCINAVATFTSGTVASGYVFYEDANNPGDQCEFSFQTKITNGVCSVNVYVSYGTPPFCTASRTSQNTGTCDFTGNANISYSTPAAGGHRR